MCLHITLVGKVRERRSPVLEGQLQQLCARRSCWEQPGMLSQLLPETGLSPWCPAAMLDLMHLNLLLTLCQRKLELEPLPAPGRLYDEVRGESWSIHSGLSSLWPHPCTPMVLPPETLVLATEEEALLWGGILFGREPGGWGGHNCGPSLSFVLPLNQCVFLGQRLLSASVSLTLKRDLL